MVRYGEEIHDGYVFDAVADDWRIGVHDIEKISKALWKLSALDNDSDLCEYAKFFERFGKNMCWDDFLHSRTVSNSYDHGD